MEPIDYFASTSFLEPKCPKCEIRIDYGVTTQWDEKESGHRCTGCGLLFD